MANFESFIFSSVTQNYFNSKIVVWWRDILLTVASSLLNVIGPFEILDLKNIMLLMTQNIYKWDIAWHFCNTQIINFIPVSLRWNL